MARITETSVAKTRIAILQSGIRSVGVKATSGNAKVMPFRIA